MERLIYIEIVRCICYGYGLDPYSTGIFDLDIVLRGFISGENPLLSPMVKTRLNLFFLLKLFCHNNNYISAVYDQPIIPT